MATFKAGMTITHRRVLMPVDGLTPMKRYFVKEITEGKVKVSLYSGEEIVQAENFVYIENDLGEEKLYNSRLFTISEYLENPSWETRHLYM